MRRRDLISPGFLYYALMAAFLYLPIALLIVFSFNDGRTLTFPLKGFTTRWYEQMLGTRELIDALWNSIALGIVSSIVATALGTLAGIGVSRFDFPGKRAFLALASMPLVIPYVVIGVALLLLFKTINPDLQLSLWTVGVGHVVINIPYCMLIVASRLAGFDAHLEEAAMDLGATYWGTLARVTLPIAAPAIVSAFLSSFTTSFDEFAVSFFLIGTESTLPIYLYSQLRFPSRLPLIVALAAVIIVASIILVIFSEALRRVGRPASRTAEA